MLVAAIVSAAFLFRDTLFGTAVDVYVVARHDIVQTVVATGRVTTPQRVSAGAVVIARSLAMNPALVLADEPSGNLDTENANAVFELMRSVNVVGGTTFLIVTHDPRLAQRCDRIVELVDGRIVADEINRNVLRHG